jgi:hypothetical protein
MNRLALSLILALPCCAAAADSNEVIVELQKQVRELRGEVERIKNGPPPATEQKNALASLLDDNAGKAQGMSFGFYGETKYRFARGGPDVADPHRLVLAPGYRFADWLVLTSELEFEHGGVDETAGTGGNGHSRFDGEIEVEQFYVDVLAHRTLNLRAPGIDLIPVGRLNLIHEPTTFYSTERPELYREIIPTTWMEPGMSLWGNIVEGLDYQVMVSTGLEDGFATAGTAGTGTRPAGFSGPGIDGDNGVRNARPRLRRATESRLAYSGRLALTRFKGFEASTSFYVTEAPGIKGSSTVSLWDIEATWRVPRTGLELRGDFAIWNFSTPSAFVANNNGSATDNVGSRMYGWYVEAAYHLWPEKWREGRKSEMDFVPFIRFTDIRTQTGLPAGSVLVTNGTQNKQYLTFGAAYFLNRNFVLKADYRRNLDATATSNVSADDQNYFQIGAGLAF